MWSDPIDELIGQCERFMDDDDELERLKEGPDRSIFMRVLNDAREHRTREKATGKAEAIRIVNEKERGNG